MTEQQPPRLVDAGFLALCACVFLAYCNISVFYSLYAYLGDIGVSLEWRGFIVGVSSLSTMACTFFASGLLTTRNAGRAMNAGVVLLMACGAGWLFARDVGSLIALRLLNGAGVYLLYASAMTFLVSRIPPGKSGMAFGLYSVAILLPFSMAPALFDWLGPRLSSPAVGYALMSLFLAPLAAINLFMGKRLAGRGGEAATQPVRFTAMLKGLAAPGVGLLLSTNAVYYCTFGSLFFLSKSLLNSRGIDNVGLFFSIQTACMIGVRLLGARVFDLVDKIWLARAGFVLSGVCFGVIYVTPDNTALYGSAVALGLGMGVGAPSLNALMFDLSGVRFKAVNSNLMLMALHMGYFVGPVFGNAAVAVAGYGGFLLVCMAMNALAIGLSVPLARTADRAKAVQGV